MVCMGMLWHVVYKMRIDTNEWGEPDKEGRRALDKAINIHAGYYIPNMYKDGHDMPDAFIVNMINALEHSFDMSKLAEDYLIGLVKAIWREWTSPPSAARPPVCKLPSLEYLDYLELLVDDENLMKTIINEVFKMDRVDDNYISHHVKAAWRNHKKELRNKYIKDKDPATVKAFSPSPFVTYEDWLQFVDMCTSSEYKALCARNAAIRLKKEVPSKLDTCNMTGIYPETAKEGNVTCDAEVGKNEADIAFYSKNKKQKTVKVPNTTGKIHEIVRWDPRSSGDDNFLEFSE
ncbi:hypothetical protein AQUCO_07600093v1 [Aquilegia coerulea]|uniref:Uncharacterized protein n=1 Tax=Aquilegia coerulea TaxID=218851 RepID=A0A2G5C8T1_AQUCA|nr:hypothetical protein AQUCO_07600093v1 [Aquilegia coerulea]